MNPKLMWLLIGVGSVIGGAIPGLWGAGIFSFSSLIFSTAGAFGGLWLAYKIGQ